MPTLSETLDTLGAAIAARATVLMGAATATDLVLLAKASEALKGGLALQAILTAGQDASAALDAQRVAALAAVTTSQGTATTAVAAAQAAAATALGTLAATATAAAQQAATDIVNALETGGGLRIGDIDFRIFPDAGNLPAYLSLCNGGTVSLAGHEQLATAWGIDDGGTLSTFVANYNATRGARAAIAIEADNIRLPDLRDYFPRITASADIGKLNIGTNQASANTGGTTTTLAVKRVDPETRPNNLSIVAVVRVG